MNRITLKKGMTFKVDGDTIVKIFAKHGSSFIVEQASIKTNISVMSIMKKDDILTLSGEETKPFNTRKFKRFNVKEMNVLSSVLESENLVSDGNFTYANKIETNNMKQSAVFGYLPMLERKGAIEIDVETKQISHTELAESLLSL